MMPFVIFILVCISTVSLVGLFFGVLNFSLYISNKQEKHRTCFSKIEFDSLLNMLSATPENFILDEFNLSIIKEEFVDFAKCKGFVIKKGIWISNGWPFFHIENNKYNKDTIPFDCYFSLKDTFIFYKYFNDWKKQMKGSWQSDNKVHNTDKVAPNGERVFLMRTM